MEAAESNKVDAILVKGLARIGRKGFGHKNRGFPLSKTSPCKTANRFSLSEQSISIAKNVNEFFIRPPYFRSVDN